MAHILVEGETPQPVSLVMHDVIPCRVFIRYRKKQQEEPEYEPMINDLAIETYKKKNSFLELVSIAKPMLATKHPSLVLNHLNIYTSPLCEANVEQMANWVERSRTDPLACIKTNDIAIIVVNMVDLNQKDVDQLSEAEIISLLMGYDTINPQRKQSCKKSIDQIREMQLLSRSNDVSNDIRNNLIKALFYIMDMHKARNDERFQFCQYLMNCMKSECILVPYRLRFKELLRGPTYWRAHTKFRHQIWSQSNMKYSKSHKWMIKNQSDYIQSVAVIPIEEWHLKVYDKLEARIYLDHHLRHWIRLGLFPPHAMWKSPSFALRRSIRDKDTPEIHQRTQYWLEIEFVDSCNAYDEYICKWLDAHQQGIIAWEWMIEPKIDNLKGLFRSEHAASLRNKIFETIPYKLWPYIGSHYEDDGGDNGLHLDINQQRTAMHQLKGFLRKYYDVGNFNVPSVPKHYYNKLRQRPNEVQHRDYNRRDDISRQHSKSSRHRVRKRGKKWKTPQSRHKYNYRATWGGRKRRRLNYNNSWHKNGKWEK